MRKLIGFLVVVILLISCTPTEKLKYTIDKPESKNNYFNDRSEKTIQPYDYLYIKIYSLDEKTAAIFDSESRSGMVSEQLVSYGVNDRGYITFPFIGEIFVKDLTIDDAKVKIEKELNQYLTNISLRVRFVGNKITVLGEVRRAGTVSFYDEKITVFDAIGLAGDIADYGDKTKITLIREKDGNITYSYLDLTDKNIVDSDNYYLLPNDVLLVDPIRQKYASLQDRSLVYLLLTGITTLASVLTTYFTLSHYK